MPRRLAWVLVLVPVCLGCGSDNEFEQAPPFRDEENVKVWANSASAVGVYMHAYEAIGVADGALTFPDPACPMTSDDGTTLTITGGCTAGEREWSGEATVVRDGGERTLTLDAFNGNEGTVVVREIGEYTNEFVADLVIGGVTAIDYTGSVEGGYDEPTTWNGSGRVQREGVIAPTGRVDATTADQVVDGDVCSGQAISGSTTLHAGDDTAVVTYDGATDCDDDQNARLSVNGKDRGLVSGIACAVGVPGRGDGAGTWGFVLALVTLLGGIARRRRRG